VTEHDQRTCLRCGKPAGDRRFCESCHSQFDSFTESLTRVAVGEVTGRPAAEVRRAASFGASEPERLAKTDQPPRECARLEEVLTPAEVDAELESYRRADAAGDAQAATNLGVRFEEKGDFEAALAAYRRAERRGDVNGSFNLGCLLAEMGDLPGAKAALGRADERGDAAAASNLGVLLEEEGDVDGALAAYRRAAERGDGAGAYNLRLLLARERPGPVERPPRRWVVAVCLVAVAAIVIARRR
jgi:TPR repeat protein